MSLDLDGPAGVVPQGHAERPADLGLGTRLGVGEHCDDVLQLLDERSDVVGAERLTVVAGPVRREPVVPTCPPSWSIKRQIGADWSAVHLPPTRSPEYQLR